MGTWLDDINMLELSAVRRPANRKRKLFQKDANNLPEDDDMPHKWIPEETLEEFLTKASLSDAQKTALKAAHAALGKAKADEMDDSGFGKLKQSLAKLLGFGKSEKSVEEVTKSLEDEKTARKSLIDVIKSAIGKLEADKPSLNEVIGALAGAVDVTPTFKRIEALPPELKAEFEALQKSREAQAKEIEELKKSQAASEAKATEREFVTKAETELPNVPLEAGLLGRLLHAISKTADDEIVKAFDRLMKSVEELAKDNELFKSRGGDGPIAKDKGGIMGKVEAMAEEVITKSEKKLTKAQAIAHVFDTHPELYEQYNNQ